MRNKIGVKLAILQKENKWGPGHRFYDSLSEFEYRFGEDQMTLGRSDASEQSSKRLIPFRKH